MSFFLISCRFPLGPDKNGFASVVENIIHASTPPMVEETWLKKNAWRSAVYKGNARFAPAVVLLFWLVFILNFEKRLQSILLCIYMFNLRR